VTEEGQVHDSSVLAREWVSWVNLGVVDRYSMTEALASWIGKVCRQVNPWRIQGNRGIWRSQL